ncbi:hypothetical protein FOL47_010464 [Perkinsus chesapeaki]|uniref:Uncharacterized protein n=1 Tax=Perkinsus chesapeaki TaxID=330153 RepID=A0A7J6MPQ3_PERCH|nr:hypothetical protein FOL47_010464 [Perkinsus chesapeaki]
MVLGAEQLVVDLLAVQQKLGDQMPLEMLHLALGYIGPRKPQKLSFDTAHRCRQCCEGSWWHRKVEADKGHAFDSVRQRHYKIDDDYVVSEQASSCHTVKIADSKIRWGILACHKDRLYLGIDYDAADRSVKEVDLKSGKSRSTLKPEFTPTVFDVTERSDKGLRFSYLDPSQRNCVFVADEGCKERRISLPCACGSVRFVTPDVICAGVSRHYELRLALIDISDENAPKYLDDFDLGVPGMYLKGMEVSPCGHVLQVRTRQRTLEIGVEYA